MRISSLKYSLIVPAFLSVSLFSCLKDDAYDNKQIQSVESDNGGQQDVISVALTATTTDNHLLVAFDQSDADTTINAVPITLGGQPAKLDLQVTLKLNFALLGSYNADNGTTHEEVPLSLLTILNAGDSANGYTVIIPKGSNTGYLQIKIKPNNFLGSDYAVGVQIVGVPAGYLIAGNLSNGIYAITVKNTYDAKYDITQKSTGWGAYGVSDGPTFTWPSPASAITASAASIDISTPEAGYNQIGFSPSGGLTSFGATTPRFTFDPATNALVAVTNTTPDDGRGRKLFLNSAVTDSRYDPETKTIYAAYIMAQTSRPNQFIYDTLRYVGPR